MKQSLLFTKTLHQAPKDEEATNANLLIQAGFVDKVMAGVYNLLPLGFRVLRKIEKIIREEMIAVGGQELVLSSLQPKKNWEQTGRWDRLDILFRFTSFHSKNEYALGPTHEEIIVPLLKKYISSYRDLPAYVFQIQNKFRDEKRAKSGLLRGREFIMKDLYSFHADEKDLDAYYEKVKKAYLKIFRRVGLGKLTYLTFASGGTFSQYSHEFQTLAQNGEDTIHLCDKCLVAINQEIIKQQKICPVCSGSNLQEKSATEIGNIFKLKTKFSEVFELFYKDKRGQNQKVYMGCYGIGLTRLIGAIVEVFHDKKGIIWPVEIAPFKFHLIELKQGLAKKIYEQSQKDGLEVLYDDRLNASIGEKLNDADLIGLPYRLVVSDKTKNKIEIKKRGQNKVKLIKYEDLRKF